METQPCYTCWLFHCISGDTGSAYRILPCTSISPSVTSWEANTDGALSCLVQQYHGNAGVIIYAKPSAKTEQLNIKLADRKKMRKPSDTKELTEGLDLNPGPPVKHETGLVICNASYFCSTDCPCGFSESAAHRRTFTWQKINYTVPVPGGERRLLHDVYGYVKPGTLTALMGSSGAGKTTCLDVLAQRKNIGVVSGSMLVDGRPVGGDFARGTAYGVWLYL